MKPVEFAKALEQRGFDSLWAPEHSHIPTSRNSPFPQGGDLPSKYYDVMDPFVSLTAAASVTSELKIATGAKRGCIFYKKRLGFFKIESLNTRLPIS